MWYLIVSIPDLCLLPYLKQAKPFVLLSFEFNNTFYKVVPVISMIHLADVLHVVLNKTIDNALSGLLDVRDVTFLKMAAVIFEIQSADASG